MGFMAVHPDAQRQGIGLALMQFVLARLEQQHVPLVTLDASAMGRPLYDRLGFVPYDETLIFERQGMPANPGSLANVHPLSDQDLDELAALDTPVFGADRRKVFQALLKVFPERAFLLRDAGGQMEGYLVAQKNRIGPWVMLQPEHADALLKAALALPYTGTVSLAVPSSNREAMELLQRRGFTPVRANRHMGRGLGENPGLRGRVYAQASLAIG